MAASLTNQDGPERIEQAYNQYTEALAWTRRNRRCKHFSDTPLGGLIPLGTMTLMTLALIFAERHPAMTIAAMLLFLAAGIAIGCWLSRQWWQTAENVQRKYAAAKSILVTSENVRTIGPLLETFGTEVITSDIAFALVRLLPRLRHEEQTLLTHSQRQRLYRLLRKPYSFNLALELAVVEAVEHIGDADAPTVLARLSQSRDTPLQLAQAAQHCLDALNARNTRENQTQTLLRAAPMPATHGAHLLRPVLTHAEPDAPEQLLRASGSGDIR